MATITLVAGKNTLELRKFLEGKGTLDIEDSYETLYSSYEEISNSIVHTDKLVVVGKKDDSSFTRNMQALRDLILGNAIFNPKDILFFVHEEGQSANFCVTAMSVLQSQADKDSRIKVPPYTVHKFSDNPSFDFIYSAIMGTNTLSDVPVAIDYVYLTEKGTESKLSFEEEDNSKNIIEPFTYKSVERFEDMKTVIRSQDSGELIYDENQKELKEMLVGIPRLSVDNMISTFALVIGGVKSAGTTTIVSAILASLRNLNSRILVIECNRRQNVSNILEKGNILFNKISGVNFLARSLPVLESGINIISVNTKDSVLLLRTICDKITKKDADFLVIDSSADVFSDILDITKSLAPKVLLATLPDEFSVKELMSLAMVASSVTLVLNKYQRDTTLSLDEVEPKRLKSMLHNVDSVFYPIFYNHLNLDEQLAVKLLGME